MDLETAAKGIKELTALHTQEKVDFEGVKKKILELKVILTKIRYTTEGEGLVQILLYLRELLELATLFAVREDSPSEFIKNYDQLRPLYAENPGKLPESQRRLQLVGVHLLLLLSDPSKRATYHALVEELDQEDKRSFHVQFLSTLEGLLADGVYTKLWKTKSNLPSSLYSNFFERFLSSCRRDFALSISASYEKMGFNELTTFLGLESPAIGKEFIENIKEELNWVVENDVVYFKTVSDSEKSRSTSSTSLPLTDLATNQLSYAKRVESIV